MRADQFEKKERQLRAALAETSARLGRHFANPAARQSAAAYLQSLLSTVERKNSWQLAEVAGLDTPYRFQHLLGRGAWDADALRNEQLGVVLGGLLIFRKAALSVLSHILLILNYLQAFHY